jgi:O-antigen/teichoic acid export membrane protein
VSGEVLRRLLGFGLPYAVISLAQNMNYDQDILFLTHFSSERVVGQYSTAVTIAEMLCYLPMATGFVLVARTALRTHETAAEETAFWMRFNLVASLATAAFIALTAPLVVAILYGSRYAESADYLRLLLPGVLFVTIFQVLSSFLLGRGALRVLLVASLGGAVLNAALNLWLDPAFGAVGACIATNVSYVVTAALIAIGFCRATGASLRSTVILQRSDVTRVVRQARAVRLARRR